MFKKLQNKKLLMFATFIFFATTISPQHQALAATPSFPRNLRQGQSGKDVLLLQQFLNSHNFLVNSSGSGSPGAETTFFGFKTKKALVKFQEEYASSILTPLGLSKGTGNFLNFTRNFVNNLLTNNSSTVPFVMVTTTPVLLPVFVTTTPNIIYATTTAGYSIPIYSGGDSGQAVGRGGPNLTTPIITFNDISTTYGDAPFALSATSTSNGAFTFTSSNTSTATINGNTVTIAGAGTSTITLAQAANGGYAAAAATALLTVNGITPEINFPDVTITYDFDMFLHYSAVTPGTHGYFISSTNPGLYTVSVGNTDVTAVNMLGSAVLSINGPGTSTLRLIQPAYNNYAAVDATALLTVLPTCSATLFCDQPGEYPVSTSTCNISTGGGLGYGPILSCGACQSGMQGAQCDTAINECADNPCGVPNGICTRTSTFLGPSAPLNSHTCSCQSGFYGNSCQFIDVSANACLGNPCNNGGTCSRASNEGSQGPLDSFSCSCATGYYGSTCLNTTSTPIASTIDFEDVLKYIDDDPFTLAVTSTSGGSISFSSSNTSTATISGSECTIGASNGLTTGDSIITMYQVANGIYTAASTSMRLQVVDYCYIPPGGSDPCNGNGECVSGFKSFTCSCNSGWTGPTCSDIDIITNPSA